MENEVLFIKKYQNAKDSYLESTILSMKELELLFHKVLKKKKKINSTEEFETVMKETLNNKKFNGPILGYEHIANMELLEYKDIISETDFFKDENIILEEEQMMKAILGTSFKKRIIKEIEKEFKIRLKKGRLKNFEKSHSNATDYNGYDLLIYYLQTYKMFEIQQKEKCHSSSNIFINCNDEPYDIDDNNTPITYTDINVFM